MKLLLDQGLPRSTVLHLRNQQIEAVHVGDRGLATATDSKLLVRRRYSPLKSLQNSFPLGAIQRLTQSP
jgi:Domain of unknown function (DUF5615)